MEGGGKRRARTRCNLGPENRGVPGSPTAKKVGGGGGGGGGGEESHAYLDRGSSSSISSLQ